MIGARDRFPHFGSRMEAAIAGARIAALAWTVAVCAACKQPTNQRAANEELAREPSKVAATTSPEEDAGSPGETTPLVPEVLPPPPPVPPVPRGLPVPSSPERNPTTAAKVELGGRLFADRALSANRKLSCETCHQPERGFASGEARDTTSAGALNLRHTPSLWNIGYFTEWTWDGSTTELDAQILAHTRGQLDADLAAVAERVARRPGYAARFQRAFGTPRDRDQPLVTAERIAYALAAYVRTLRSGASPWDLYEAGQRDAVSPDAIAGARLFSHSLGCATCHPPPLYTDGGYHDRGIDQTRIDPGRARATGDIRDEGLFRTAPLRGLVYTAPYFHDGSRPTLEEAVAHELHRSGHLTIAPLHVQQLLAFLRALSPPLPP